MKMLLIKPPMADPTLPSLSIPTLSAFAKKNGHEVDVYDLAIEVFNHVTAPSQIEQNIKIIETKFKDYSNNEFIKLANTAKTLGSSTIKRINKAKKDLRTKENFYNYTSYKSALHVLENAIKIFSAAYYPTVIEIGNYHLDKSHTLSNIEKHITDSDQNAFLSYFREIAVPKIVNKNYNLIGISITYRSQFLPTLSLVRELQKRRQIPIILGGAFLTSLGYRLCKMDSLLVGVKGIVLFEGETALVDIANRLERGLDIKDAVNTYTIETLCTTTNVLKPSHVENFEDLPTPDFSGIPLEKYITPEPILPIQSCRGCFWGQCTFCAVSKATSSKFRDRASKIMEDFDTLHRQYSCNNFFICDDATPMKTLKMISTNIIQNRLPYHWSTEVRFGPYLTESNCKLLSEGGCVHLLFGFESASERILKLMQKGPTHLWRMQNLIACKTANIGVNLQSFVGFPGENESDALSTEKFFLENKPLYTSIAIGSYTAVLGSEVTKNPSKFGVRLLEEKEALIETWHHFEVSDGMDAKEAARIADEIRSGLIMDDIVGPGFLYGSSGAHGQLFFSRYGRIFVDNLGVDSFRWNWDITDTQFIASQSAKKVNLPSDECLIYDINGHSLILNGMAIKAFEIFKKSPHTIPDAVTSCLSGGNDMADEEWLLLLANSISIFIRLARMGILIPYEIVTNVPNIRHESHAIR